MKCFIYISTVIVLFNTGVSNAQAAETNREQGMEVITVVGTRTERTLSEVAATVSVTTSRDIERKLSRDIADLVRFQPGVSVGGTGSRFGLGGFNIRGIGGNRVLTLVDGVRVADEFSFGAFLNARRDFVDIDSLSRAEISRGPISSLYGSDALGGVVAFTTKGPRDYLARGDEFYAGLKSAYSSADSSKINSLTLATGNDRISGMILYTNRDQQESDNSGTIGGLGIKREKPDPQSIDTNNVVAKLSLTPNRQQRLTLTVDHFKGNTDTQILSDYGSLSRGTLINRRDAQDERTRTGISLAHDYSGALAFADQIQTSIYSQRSETIQLTIEDRLTQLGAAQTRNRTSVFDQDIEGAYMQLSKSFDIPSAKHLLIYGVDYNKTRSAGLRNGGTHDSSGNAVPEFFPFPTRDFPPTKVEQIALFVQDEISLLDGQLLISPSIRYDRFDADATADSIFLSGNPGSPLPEDYADDQLTGKLGAILFFTDSVSSYARVSEGFRAPPYDSVNVGFSNFIAGYKTISNPDLESEQSLGFELGVRLENPNGNITISVFENNYENFIESFAIAPQFHATGGIDPVDGLLAFQSINREEVEIKGAELSASLEIGNLNQRLQGISIQTSIAYAEGEDKDTSEPINSIEPLSAVFGLSYNARSDRWGGELMWTLVNAKDESDIDANNLRLATAGYGIVDLLAYLRLTDRVRINAGLFNIGDKSYIRWADTAGIGADASARFTQPGFNFGATVRFEL